MAQIFVDAFNFLPLFGRADATRPDGLHIEFVNHSLLLTQTITVHEPKVLTASNKITFSQGLNKSLGTKAKNQIQFTGLAAKAKPPLFATSVIQFSHSARNITQGIASNTLLLTQIVIPSRSFTQKLTLTQTLSVQKIDAITVIQTIPFASHVIVFKTNDPFAVLIPTPAFPQPLVNVVLTFGPKTLSLRPPILTDVDSIEHAKINRRTRGGDLKIFRDPNWPRTEILRYKFENITEDKSKQFLEFLEMSFGKDITLVDYEGFTWTGIIINAEALITQFARGKVYNCDPSFSFDLEFQGVQS